MPELPEAFYIDVYLGGVREGRHPRHWQHLKTLQPIDNHCEFLLFSQ